MQPATVADSQPSDKSAKLPNFGNSPTATTPPLRERRQCGGFVLNREEPQTCRLDAGMIQAIMTEAAPESGDRFADMRARERLMALLESRMGHSTVARRLRGNRDGAGVRELPNSTVWGLRI